jgi:hypothetical protein
MKPTVGRIVHYYSRECPAGETPTPQAAIITAVHETDERIVDLCVFGGDYGMRGTTRVPGGDAETFKPGGALPCWTWPPRE